MIKTLYNILSKTLNQNLIRKTVNNPQFLFQRAYSRSSNKKSTNKLKDKAQTEAKKDTIIPMKNKKSIFKLILMGTSLASIGTSLVLILGAPAENLAGEPVKDDLFSENVIKQYIIRTYRQLEFYFKLIQVPLNEKLLPDPLDYPYLQPKYTLVLELTDVLVHLDWAYIGECKFKKRPLLDHFLQTLRDSYEIIIYTAEQGRLVFSVTDVIDPKHIIAYKLVHGTTHFTGRYHIKKLDALNRDLRKVICVDWDTKHLKYNPDNLLCVKRWAGNDDDTSLLDLAMFLKTIADNDIDDVRDVLKYYSKYDDPVDAFRKKQEKLIEELEEKAAAQQMSSRFKLSRFRL